jgi:transcriptional regulator
MLIHPWDAGRDDQEWMSFIRRQGFAQLIAAGRGRDVAIVVPTQFLLLEQDGADEGWPEVILHLARPNPIWKAVDENPTVLLSVAGDWAYVPTSWKAIGDEDPTLGIPTTYYAAVQLVAQAEIVDDPAGKLAILRKQLGAVEPDGGWADPSVHERQLPGIRGLRLTITNVAAKFKYGGNVDDAHRQAVADRLEQRDGPGDEAARTHLLRRM